MNTEKKLKKTDFSEWYNRIIYEADLVDIRVNIKGFLVHKPWSMLCIREIYRLYEKELEKTGHMPTLFPIVIPESNIKKESEHIKGFQDEVFWITHQGKERMEEKLCLRPTSETIIYPMFSLWIRSYKDLPLKIYQSCAVYRAETKATKPLIRGREFLWIEAHDAFASMEDSEKQIIEDMEIAERVIHQELCIPFILLRRPEWDKFPGAESTFAFDTIMPDGKILQIATTHLLAQNFSKPFDIKFTKEDGKEEYVYQTCYGPGIWRIFAALISLHGDDRGLIFPFKVAPIQVIIVPIFYSEEEKSIVEKKCKNIEKVLKENGIRVMVDTTEKTPGEKFYYWEMRGVPIRIEIGMKEIKSNTLTIHRREKNKRERIEEDSILKRIEAIEIEIKEKLRNEAEKFFKSMISVAKTKEKLKEIIEKKGGLVKVGFCGSKRCAQEIKSETTAEVRGYEFASFERDKEDFCRCVWCGKKSKEVVYIGKSY